MDWLKKLPVIGPFVARLMLTHAWRTYERLERVHWTRLAAAITFISFVALFPLITVAAAVGAGLLSQRQLDDVQDSITEQVPGISKQLDVNSLVANAGTIGVVAGILLFFTGISWMGSMRGCLRAVWELDDTPEGTNIFAVRAKDGLVLLGLGAVGLASLGASGFGSVALRWSADRLGIPPDGAGGVLLQVAAIAVGVGADFLLLLYVLTLLPRVHPTRRRLIVAALVGAVGFELLKLLLGGYFSAVAAKSMYGAFGVPIALLLWINFTAKLLLICAAWTATGSKEEEVPGDDGGGGDDDQGDDRKDDDRKDGADKEDGEPKKDAELKKDGAASTKGYAGSAEWDEAGGDQNRGEYDPDHRNSSGDDDRDHDRGARDHDRGGRAGGINGGGGSHRASASDG